MIVSYLSFIHTTWTVIIIILNWLKHHSNLEMPVASVWWMQRTPRIPSLISSNLKLGTQKSRFWNMIRTRSYPQQPVTCLIELGTLARWADIINNHDWTKDWECTWGKCKYCSIMYLLTKSYGYSKNKLLTNLLKRKNTLFTNHKLHHVNIMKLQILNIFGSTL